jgi:hypothetical protein
MCEQLTHVAELAERPNISVEVVPSSTGANAGLGGGFQLASCDGAPDVLNMNGVQDVTGEGRSLVRHATRIFDLVRGDALPRAASRTPHPGGSRTMESTVEPRWRKSSHSGNGGSDCVEVARNVPGVVAVRDSKNSDGPALVLPAADWQGFMASVKAGRFDLA